MNASNCSSYVRTRPSIRPCTRRSCCKPCWASTQRASRARSWFRPRLWDSGWYAPRPRFSMAASRLRFLQERELPQRLGAVLDAIYAAFGIGWDDMEGADQHGRNLAEEAIWLARVLLQLMPGEPEVEGLLALTLHCEARRAARRDRDGRYVPLSEQDPKLWSLSLIEEAGAPSCRSFQTWASGTLP